MTQETKHTPAPWRLSETIGHSHVRGANGDTVVGYSIDSPKNRHFHDARLIAAAPELLEALEELLPTEPIYYQKMGKTPNKYEKALKAIAKARSE